MVEVKKIYSKKDIKKFIKFAYKIYNKKSFWVAPLESELVKLLNGKNNVLFNSGPHEILLAEKNGILAGRMLIGIDEKDNAKHNVNKGYFSLFECIDDKEVAFALWDYASNWMKERGIEKIYGPVSPSKGDDYKGFLVEGFDGLSGLMNSYNPKYYNDFASDYGFAKADGDLLAFYIKTDSFPEEKYDRLINYSMKKFNYRIESVDLDQVGREIKDIKYILDNALPDDWNMSMPTVEDIRDIFQNLKMFIDPNLVYIARKNETDEPISFVVAVPDYNQILHKMRGRILPFGWIKYLLYRKKISQMRVFIQFVIPKYQGKGINAAIFYQLFKYGRMHGYLSADGSTIGEDNDKSRKSVESICGEVYRRYRRYEKELRI